MADWPATLRTYETGFMDNAENLNEQIRDVHIVLGENAHSGAPGDGSEHIVPDTVTFGSISEPGTPAADKIVWWVDGETLKIKDSSGTVTAVSLEGHSM